MLGFADECMYQSASIAKIIKSRIESSYDSRIAVQYALILICGIVNRNIVA